MIREVLMAGFGVVWGVVVLLTAWRTGSVPPQLWAVLGVGEGALVAVFKTERYVNRRRKPEPPDPDPLEDSP
jgi:hypothetical protein